MKPWVKSIRQPPPARLEDHLDPYRCAVLAGLFNVTASQRWLAEGPPDPIIVDRNGWVEVLLEDEEDSVSMGPLPWWAFFVESWSREFEFEFRDLRREVAEEWMNNSE